MTRTAVVSRLVSRAVGSSRASASQHTLSAQPWCIQGDESHPSTIYGSCEDWCDLRNLHRAFSANRRFCSWPANAAHALAQPTTSAGAERLGFAPGSPEDYQRRLQEFLSASRVHRSQGTAQAGPASSLPQPAPRDPASHAADPSRTSLALDDPTTATSARLNGTTAAEPPTQGSAALSAAPSEAPAAPHSRTRTPLPDFSTFRPRASATAAAPGGGCSTGSSSSGSSSSTAGDRFATRAQPLPTPSSSSSPSGSAAPSPPPQPHPASPTPVDWREVLRRAREAQAGQQQHLTGKQMLTDKFSRTHTYLRISLTERCNLRCSYCMPAEGVALTPHQQLLTTQEIMRLARLFVEAGVTKVRLTGGEPTLRRDIEPLVRQLGELRPMGLRAVALTSNGLVLGRQLPALREAGLTAVNISLDTLRPDRFLTLARRPGHSRVLEAIRGAVELGYDPVKINVVVMRGVNEDEVAAFAALTQHQPINVRFIEYMPFDGNVWSDSKMVPYRELLSRLQAAFPHTPLERLDDPAGEVAKNYRLKGYRGSVSFITSMTQHFCSDCNRLRLLADGNLKVCLFGASEVSLRDAMRGGATDSDLRAVIWAAVQRKRAAHAGAAELAAASNRPMITIGG